MKVMEADVVILALVSSLGWYREVQLLRETE